MQHPVVQVLALDRHDPGRTFDVRVPEEPEALGRRQAGSNRKIPDRWLDRLAWKDRLIEAGERLLPGSLR